MLRTFFSFFFLLAMVGNYAFSPLLWAEKDIEKSVQSYKQAYRLFEKKEYRVALQYFLDAKEFLPDLPRYKKTQAAFSYFIGICSYHSGLRLRAKDNLTFYLQSSFQRPDKTQKAQEYLAKLQKEEKPLITVPFVTNKPPKKNPPRKVHPFGIVLTVVGGSALIAGGVLAWYSGSQYDALNKSIADVTIKKEISATLFKDKYEAIHQLSWLSTGLFVGGGTAFLAGSVLLFVWKTQKTIRKESSVVSMSKNSWDISNISFDK